MKISAKFSKPPFQYLFLFLLMAPFFTKAQAPGMQPRDSIRMDSMRKAFIKADSIRIDSIVRDTTGNAPVKSALTGVYPGSQTAIGTGQRLSVQGIHFKKERYLKIVLQGGMNTPVNVNEGATLQFLFDDSSSARLTVTGATSSRPGRVQHSAELITEYRVLREDFKSLQNKTVTDIVLTYTGGSLNFNIDAVGAAAIKNICAIIK